VRNHAGLGLRLSGIGAVRYYTHGFVVPSKSVVKSFDIGCSSLIVEPCQEHIALSS
jgi:hypothetical protein